MNDLRFFSSRRVERRLSASKAVLRRFRGDRKGVAAVEFAIILPILIVILAGTVELQEALTVHRKLDQIASTVADLVGQESSLSPAEMNSIFSGAETILRPYNADGLKILVLVTDTLKNADRVAWAAARDSKTPRAGTKTTIPIPEDMREVGVQMVAVQVNYRLTTTFSALFDSYPMEVTHFTRPRSGNVIEFK